jgi:hypothetical protein
VLEVLTGTGLAASAGLNAYIPLLALGLLDRYTNLITMPDGWRWISNGWVLALLTVLLAVEVVADKIPVMDSVNDVVQTFIRPTSGGLAFGAGATSETVTVSDPGSFFSSNDWVPVAAGVLIALVVHAVKAICRPAINAVTVGFGAPVASTAEDATSVVMSVLAIVLPFLVILMLLGMIVVFTLLLRRRARRRREKRQQREQARAMAAAGYPPNWPPR